MNIKGIISVLDNMGAFHLHKLHGMLLNPEVECSLEPNITHPELVGLVMLEHKQGLVGSISLGILAIDDNTMGFLGVAAAVQDLSQVDVTLLEPVTDEDSEVVFWVGVRNRNQQTAVDPKATEATRGLVHASAGVVDVTSDLVLNLELVGVVLPWWNRAVGARNSILPRVLPLLYTSPSVVYTQS